VVFPFVAYHSWPLPYVYTYVCIRVRLHMYIYIYVHIYIHMYIYIHTYTYIYKHTFTYIHAYNRRHRCGIFPWSLYQSFPPRYETPYSELPETTSFQSCAHPLLSVLLFFFFGIHYHLDHIWSHLLYFTSRIIRNNTISFLCASAAEWPFFFLEILWKTLSCGAHYDLELI